MPCKAHRLSARCREACEKADTAGLGGPDGRSDTCWVLAAPSSLWATESSASAAGHVRHAGLTMLCHRV